jgi:diaminopimelate epimerase
MKLELPRMHGCENRFAVVDEHVHEIPERDKVPLVVAMADRAGVHGVLFLSSRGRLRMRIFDRDGTEESMCGNGIRCAARYLRDRGYVARPDFTIQTLDGPKSVMVEPVGITVDMGSARGYRRLDGQRHFAFTGIPHLVILGGPMSVGAARAEGRRLRCDRRLGDALGYPEGVHVNFVRVGSRGGLSVLTYEAGVEDVTPACGTGSTAAAYVCARIGRIFLPARVSLLGGELTIDSRGDTLTMHGPAEYMTPFAFEWPAEDWSFVHQVSADPELAAAGSVDGRSLRIP